MKENEKTHSKNSIFGKLSLQSDLITVRTLDLNVVNKSNNKLPEYAHWCDAGCDIRVDISLCDEKFMYGGATIQNERGDRTVILPPGARALIPSGIRFQVPAGFEVQVRPRSGLTLKYGITLLNSPGTIDSNYTGDVGLVVHNAGTEPFEIVDGMRLGQLVLNQISKINWVEVDSLEDTDRGSGGFGHTGSN